MSRATPGVLPPTPVDFLQAEGGSIPAAARLQGRQEAPAIRLASKDEPAMGLLHAGTGLGERLRGMVGGIDVGIEERGTRGKEVEKVRCSRGLFFPGVINVPAVYYDEKDRKEVARAAEEDARAMGENTDTIWTNGSRLEDGRVGVGIAWMEGQGEDDDMRMMTKRRDFRTAGE